MTKDEGRLPAEQVAVEDASLPGLCTGRSPSSFGFRPSSFLRPMKRISRNQATKYAFDWRDEPLLEVEPGERFAIETWDASTGYFKTESDLAIPAQRPGFDRIP